MSASRTSHRTVPADQIDYIAEAELVQERAVRSEPSVIRLGPIMFFSTESHDAWMIDVQNGEAACLTRAGEAQTIPIVETPSRLGIAWQARYRLDGETFVVTENDGSTRKYLNYPAEEIRRLITEYPAEYAPIRAATAVAARERLRQTARNDPCPCGSGRIYKKCCLPLDDAAVASASREVQRTELRPRSSPEDFDGADATIEDGTADFAKTDDAEPPAGPEIAWEDEESELAPEVAAAVDRIWAKFERIKQPTRTQLDALLDQLIALPPEATRWSDTMDVFCAKGHPDLPSVFRRIAAALPPTREAGASYFYWNAMENFVPSGRDDLVPEIVSGFRRLTRDSYDADALRHIVLWAMAAGRDADALALEEHFLPIMRADPNLMPYAVPSACHTIFELRVGLRLREIGSATGNTEALTGDLYRDVEDDIHVDFARRAAQVIRGELPSGKVQREDFHIPRHAVREGSPAWEQALRQFEAVMHVAHEAWQSGGRPPGSAFRGLWLLVDAVYDERGEYPRSRKTAESLLDCLRPSGMERRIAFSTRDELGTNTPHAHLLIEAHADLLDFADRHRLISEIDAAKSANRIEALRSILGFVARASERETSGDRTSTD